MTSDTSERGLERLICTALTGAPGDLDTAATVTAHERPATYPVGWVCGASEAYDREYCVDLAQLSAFLQQTQPEGAEALALAEDGPTWRKFLARLQGEVTKRGTIDVLRHDIKHGALHIDLSYGTPTPGNAKGEALSRANRFSVTRQLRYRRDETQRALDLGLFINGLPVATFELKNSLIKQTVQDAVEQYKRDRDPREKLFESGRCVAHLAAQQEIFGPVIALLAYDDEADAVRIANHSMFGLFGAVFSADTERAHRIARRVRTWALSHNAFRMDPFLPFGGFKQSGIGREGGTAGVMGYTETKTILLDAAVNTGPLT